MKKKVLYLGYLLLAMLQYVHLQSVHTAAFLTLLRLYSIDYIDYK